MRWYGRWTRLYNARFRVKSCMKIAHVAIFLRFGAICEYHSGLVVSIQTF